MPAEQFISLASVTASVTEESQRAKEARKVSGETIKSLVGLLVDLYPDLKSKESIPVIGLFSKDPENPRGKYYETNYVPEANNLRHLRHFNFDPGPGPGPEITEGTIEDFVDFGPHILKAFAKILPSDSV
jgi:hypothetical protein